MGKISKIISLIRLLFLAILAVISLPALSNEGFSHFAIRSGSVDISSMPARKAVIKFVKNEIDALLKIKQGLKSDEIQWLDDAPTALRKIYPNENEYHKKLMDLITSKKYSSIHAHHKIERLLKSINANVDCALKASSVAGEGRCLFDLSQNMLWMMNSYDDINTLRKNTNFLVGKFANPEYIAPDLFIYTIFTNASTINRILEASIFSK